MTPLDFSVLTGLDVGGWSIPYDEDMGEWEAAWMYLLGAHPPVDRVSGRVRYTWFSSHCRRAEMVPETPEETEQYARGFLMFLFGTTLFADRGNTVGLYLLSTLVDLSQVSRYDWGGAGLATLYFYMSATSRGRVDLLGGYWRAWELWVYVYFPALAPELEVAGPPMTPYSLVFEGLHRPRPRETLLYLRQYFDTVRHSEARARAADAPSTSRAGTSRGGGRSVPPTPPTYPHPGWPDMPFELTGWRFGTPYPITLEPPLPDHRYVRDPDSPPPPVEYVDEILGVMASLEGMVLRRETHLSAMGAQIPPVYAPPQAGPPG
ncbi:uncharacterized protein LOC114303031, partial [Camellia sinensis]|uniref:uncharacterized protein LOC114303031 n=1 Tax=Camellia sinensis TaxID=4442 RepID=UPI0010363A43